MDLEDLRGKYIDDGYSMANATAKVCQDILLNKISKSSFNKNVTIKGGVVMHSISNDKRRATRDLDLDFIKYSLDDKSIKNFIDKLNILDDGVKIVINGPIKELHHQDYDGKRVIIKIIDHSGFSVVSKLDIGVHKFFDVKQEEYCFNLNIINESATLLVNSKEQIMVEKLKSLLKFGVASTRYKDIYDLYYLINNFKLDKDELFKLINIFILSDDLMKQISIKDIILDLKDILNDDIYLSNLEKARNNWLEIETSEAINSIIHYFESLELIEV